MNARRMLYTRRFVRWKYFPYAFHFICRYFWLRGWARSSTRPCWTIAWGGNVERICFAIFNQSFMQSHYGISNFEHKTTKNSHSQSTKEVDSNLDHSIFHELFSLFLQIFGTMWNYIWSSHNRKRKQEMITCQTTSCVRFVNELNKYQISNFMLEDCKLQLPLSQSSFSSKSNMQFVIFRFLLFLLQSQLFYVVFNIRSTLARENLRVIPPRLSPPIRAWWSCLSSRASTRTNIWSRVVQLIFEIFQTCPSLWFSVNEKLKLDNFKLT